jgi:tetratricopeptide (TPR) repeat protein
MSEIFHVIADARRAAFEHRFEDAAALALRALHSSPGCLPALRILAWAQLELEDDAALASFEKCTVYDPEDGLAHVGQAIWYQQRRDKDAALRQWVRALELDPHNQAIRRVLVKLTGELPESPLADAISLLRRGRPDEAAEALRALGTEQSDPAVAVSLITAL